MVTTDYLNTFSFRYFVISAEMVDSIVFVIKTKIVDSSAPNPRFHDNKRTIEALFTIRLAILVKIDDNSVIYQMKHIMLVVSFLFLRSVVAFFGIFHVFLYSSH